MQVQVIADSFDKHIFNSVSAHPLQSWEWGEARKKMGIDVLRLGEFSKDQLEHVFQITLHPIPYTRFKIGYLPRSVWPSKKTFEFLFDYGKKHGIIFTKIEPYAYKKNYKLPTTEYKLIKSSHPLFPEWSQVLNLNKSEDELLRSMHSKTRYNIRLAEKKGVVVKEMSDEKGFEIFSKLYFETCKRQKYFGHSPRYHKIVWESLKKDIAHILIAFYNDTPLAAYELFYFNKVFYYPYGGTSLEYRNFMAANLLMWEAIKLGKKLGAEHFDMWGSLPPQYSHAHSWAGFTRFKEGYGTSFIEFVGSYDLIINETGYSIYNFAYKLREMYLDAKKII
jgi:lipid II:glycine glycyltransferase (peptidoglycan interpeptide bridge formation enzyme)